MTKLSFEEGYELTNYYVNYFWDSKKFYSLAHSMEKDDLLQSLMVKFLEKDFYSKYDSTITSKKYFVMIGVRNYFIDELRKQKRKEVSIDAEDEDGLSILDRVVSNIDIESEVLLNEVIKGFLDILPDDTNSKVIGQSPIKGEISMSHRQIAIHLVYGYNVTDISKMFFNENSGRTISTATISRKVKEIRELSESYFNEVKNG